MENIEQQIASLRSNYYSENKKNIFFKNSQKQDFAKTITQNIDVQLLMAKSVYILENSDIVYIDYPILKTFLCEDIYEVCIQFLLNKYLEVINKYTKYSVHVNLQGFSVSAAQRYQKGIMLFTERCNASNAKFPELLEKMVIINTPSVIEAIQKMLRPFIDPIIFGKIHIQPKN